MQNLSKTVRKGMFPTGILLFFWFFSQFVIFFAKNQRDITFWTLKPKTILLEKHAGFLRSAENGGAPG